MPLPRVSQETVDVMLHDKREDEDLWLNRVFGSLDRDQPVLASILREILSETESDKEKVYTASVALVFYEAFRIEQEKQDLEQMFNGSQDSLQ